jgi:hypothetical protein
MLKTSKLKLLSSSEIDKAKWDRCIDESDNTLIYAKSFYLDNLHANWCGVIAENYDWVLPVTSRKKWSISYLFQPAFVQQLGIFARPSSTVPYSDIIHLLQKQYKFWEISWNYATPVAEFPPEIEKKPAANYILDLSSDYDTIFASYHKDLIKNLKKAEKNSLTYLCSNDFKNCINLFKKHYSERLPNIKNEDYLNFRTVCDYALQERRLVCRQAANEEGELLSSILLLKDKNRLYNLMNTTTDSGRKSEANHFLMDGVIHEFAGSGLILDFEGSDIPGIKAFYENFGSKDQPYYMLKYNNLPWPIQFIKD